MSMVVQLLRNRLVITARNSMSKNASLGQLYGNMQEVYHQMQTPLIYQDPSVKVSLCSKLFLFLFPYRDLQLNVVAIQ